MANLTGSPLDLYVQEQIDIRQKVLGNNPDIQSLDVRILNNHNKNAWLRLASSVDVKNEKALSSLGDNITIPLGENLAKGFVLIGGVTNTINGTSFPRGGVIPNQLSGEFPLVAAQYSYGLGNRDYGLQPPPGLISAQIQHLNRGAIRKFQIKLQAQNKDQMAILEALYLRLGYYMLLEWGHTNYIDRNKGYISRPDFNTPAFNLLFEKGNIDSDIETAIGDHRRNSGGNYDGALFKVDNYSWSVNSDGSYDITLSGVSKGGLIDSLIIGSPGIFDSEATPIEDYIIINPSTDEKRNILKNLGVNANDKDLVDVYTKTVSTKLANGEYQKLKLAGAIQIKNPNSITSPDVLNVVDAFDTSDDDLVTTILDQNKSILNQVLFKLTRELKKQSWKTINDKKRYKNFQLRPELLQSLGLPELKELLSIKFDNVNKESNPYEYNYITLGSLISIIKEKVLKSPNNTKIKMSDGYEDNLMLTHWFQHSTDPAVCVIPFSIEGNTEDNLNSIISTAFRKGSGGNESFQGRLMAIHVNIEYITKTLQDTAGDGGEINLYTFLEKLMYGIQDALGGINNFTVTYDDINGINIKDDTIIPGVEEDNDTSQTKLRLYGTLPNNEGSFVRNVSAQSKITGKMATQIAIGSTASGNTVSNSTSLLARWNEGLVDRLQLAEQTKIELQRMLISGAEGDTSSINEIEEELNKKYETQKEFLIKQYQEFQNLGEATYTQANANLKTLLEYDMAVKTLNGNIAGKGFIPIDLTVELEGISGILLYNKLITTDEILPSSYNNKIDFIITAMDHSISNNEWVTTLSTLSVPKKTDTANRINTKDNNEFSIPNPVSSQTNQPTNKSTNRVTNSPPLPWSTQAVNQEASKR